MKLAYRVTALALCAVGLGAYTLGHTEWLLPVAALACVTFFLGLRSEFAKTRDESLAEATDDAASETQS
jgi:hypothetical protein